MIALLAQVDPVGVTQSLQLQSLAIKDFLLGFFIALALRRGRVTAIIDRALPMTADNSPAESSNEQSDDTA